MMYNRRGREIDEGEAIARLGWLSLFEKGDQFPAIRHPRTEIHSSSHHIGIVCWEEGGGVDLRMTSRISPTSGLCTGVAISKCESLFPSLELFKQSVATWFVGFEA